MHRIHNFNAGPAVLPIPVLEEMQAAIMDFAGTGMGIMEISHRAKKFDEVLDDAIVRTKRLLGLGDNYRVLFLQGGASTQFAMAPMNLLGANDFADYTDTGTWASKAFQEVKIVGKNAQIIASSKADNYTHIPQNVPVTPGAKYVHITSNNTIKGTEWATFPDTGNVPIVCDMSSDYMSRPVPVEKFGLIYGGAQKNIGPAGVVMVIIRDDILAQCQEGLPTMLSYKTHADNNSLYNTAPVFGIYTIQLVMKWLEETIGGLDKMAEINRKKAKLVYDVIDAGDFYTGTAQPESRSLMNLTFRLKTEELENMFTAEAKAHGMEGLKGHRSVGGCRASLYNACSLEAARALAEFMKEFAKKNG